MKEKINQFAKGIFEYEKPTIVSKPQSLQFSVDAGETYRGSFLLSNDHGRVMKGIVCTDCHHLVLEEESFQGAENKIHFVFHAVWLMPGETVQGDIRIVSDMGSVVLPFSAAVCVPSCVASTGRIKDLLHFAKFARQNMTEAINLFGSPGFEAIFQGQDARWKSLYRGLSRGADKGIAMEEFLISIHKKVPVQLSVQNRLLHYRNCGEAFRDKLAVCKDTWGYGEYEVSADADFVELEHHRLRITDFVGDLYELGFVIHPEKMTGGRNYARITISDVRQTIEVDIIADRGEYDSPQLQQTIEGQRGVWQLYRNFVSFRCEKISKKEYCLAVERVVCTMDKMPEEQEKYHWLKRVFQIHLGILNHLEESVSMQLGQMEERIKDSLQENPLLYCAYFYLLALFCRQDEVTAAAADKVRECYLSREDHWLVLWFWMELDEKNLSVRKRQELLLEKLQQGCQSPLIYLKLCRLYQETPELLLELDPARERCLHWGCRQGILGRELMLRYTHLIGRQKNFSRPLLEDLCTVYEEKPSDDILAMICQMLMRDRRGSRDAVKWYAMAIEKNLKITDLYENYMYALEESADMALPEKALLYFTYVNHLNTTKKALLYAYVIRHKEKDRKTYEAYLPTMKRFAVEQLLEGRISENLAVVYEEFICEETLDETLARKLPEVLFAREVTCYNGDIIGVAVAHRELEKEEFVPLVQGKAVISSFTGNTQVFLLDTGGNRYSASIDYTSSHLIHLDHLAQKCLEYVGDDTRLLLYLYDSAESRNQTGDHVKELGARILNIPRLEEEFKKKVFAKLVSCYFNSFEGELLDYQLQHMDWRQVDAADRDRLVEYCAIRHCNDKGMEGIMAFGYEKLDAKRLLQISAAVFQKSLDDRRPELVKLAWFIFRKGQFDENMLRYLCDYFSGDVRDMIKIWKAADGFGLDAVMFAERILAQIVFVEEMVPEGYEVFYRYYEEGFNKKLNRALLKMLAYQYLVKGQKIPDKMFDYFYQDVKVEDNLPCLLAALRHMSQKEFLTGQESIFVDYNIHQLCERNIVLGFYRDFYGKISLPERLLQEQCIEYTAAPESSVRIEYRIVSGGVEGEYTGEAMHNVFEGIRVKTVVLFRDEVMQYRIVEKRRDGRIKKTEIREITCSPEVSGNGSWYRMINQMMAYRENGDDMALINSMQKYAEKREMVSLLIKPAPPAGEREKKQGKG